jgi:hypothetical protein
MSNSEKTKSLLDPDPSLSGLLLLIHTIKELEKLM